MVEDSSEGFGTFELVFIRSEGGEPWLGRQALLAKGPQGPPEIQEAVALNKGI